MAPQPSDAFPFPHSLADYPPASPEGLWATLSDRVAVNPFNLVATTIFALAILHTFVAPRIASIARDREQRLRLSDPSAPPSVAVGLLHFLGEVEVVFGLWATVLVALLSVKFSSATAAHYLNDAVNYTEPLFVFVIMALASARPIVGLAEGILRRVANLGGGTAGAWWLTILTIAPLLGSLITEPAAMTIAALLLGPKFFDFEPSVRLKYATLGVLFVNVSIGGTLTHFAAPPVLMVARPWNWDTPFMFLHFGRQAIVAILAANVVCFVAFRRQFRVLAGRTTVPHVDVLEEGDAPGGIAPPVPPWIAAVHVFFMALAVAVAHQPALLLGAFLFFLGFVRTTAHYQSPVDLKAPLMVGFFLAGLVVHGGLQGWWIEPVLASLSRDVLFGAATVLTAFNDNALVTYLATLVPDFSDPLKLAVVRGAIVGGGLTVIANAPNPAGQALLGRYFGGSVSPVGLLLGALGPTFIAIAAFTLG